MRTEAVPGVTEENGFAVARLSRDFPNRSYLGGIVVSRRGYGPDSKDDYNHTFSLDGRWGIGEYGLVQGFVAKTETPGADEGEHAFQLAGNYDSEKWSYSASYTEVADDFNPEVGFLTRRGYRKPSVFRPASHSPRGPLGAPGNPSARLVQRVLGFRRFPGDRISSTSIPTGSGARPTNSTPASTSPARG